MADIIVRSETTDDIKAIDVVNISAFEGEQEARLVTELRGLPGYRGELSLVAEFGGRIVGHLMLSPVTLHQNDQDIRMLALGPMSVVPSQSHRGIGTALVDAAIAKAKDMGQKGIIVVGPPDYYLRFGFASAAERDIRCNLPAPQEAVMVMELEQDALAGGGTVNYPPPFSRLY